MKFSFTATISTAAATAVSAWTASLSEYGTSLPVLVVALIGAITALPELSERPRKALLGALVFGLAVGALGAPVAAEYLDVERGISHPAIPLLLALLLGHFANDIFRPVVAAVSAAVAKRISK